MAAEWKHIQRHASSYLLKRKSTERHGATELHSLKSHVQRYKYMIEGQLMLTMLYGPRLKPFLTLVTIRGREKKKCNSLANETEPCWAFHYVTNK